MSNIVDGHKPLTLFPKTFHLGPHSVNSRPICRESCDFKRIIEKGKLKIFM